MRKYLLLFPLVFFSSSIIAQEREFSTETLQSMQNDSDYIYTLPQHKLTIWDHIGNWISELLSKVIRSDIRFNGDVFEVFIWILIISFVLWGIISFLKANRLFIFTSSGKINRQDIQNFYTNNETSIPLSEQLEEAIKQNDYHEIVRLYYLLAIEKLDHKKVINLRKVDHHNDILLQLKEENLKSTFNSIGLYFQYCWYGEFDANDTICEQLKSMYQNLQIAIEKHEKD